MNKEFLFELLRTDSVSGNETKIEKKIYDYMSCRADEVRVDELGNVTAVVNPDCPFKVLLTGHCDEIGLMISAVEADGMLRVVSLGHVYPTNYVGQKVRIHTDQGVVYGAVQSNRHLTGSGDLKASELRIDIGAVSREDALKAVSLGDTVTLDTDVRELLHDRIAARALDNRLGAFIVMEALALAREKGVKVGAYAAATTGEETTMNGAYFTASRVQPNIAIAVDVTYTSDNAGVDPGLTGEICLEGGPVLCNNPSVHKRLNKALRAAADSLSIAVQYEAATGRTGTDGDVMHKTGIGVPFALVSIPLRYMHNPAEVGSLRDVQQCIDLLAEFLCRCRENMNLKPF